jgi:hypothetical protein
MASALKRGESVVIPLVPVKARVENYEMDVGESADSLDNIFVTTLLDELRFVEKAEGLKTAGADAEFVTLTTKVPHGIRTSGTQVVLENFGPSSGTRTVYVEDEFTLVMKRKPGEQSQPKPSLNARLYVPYTNTTGLVQYTRGEDGRPAKNTRQCARREAYQQCESMPNANERTYTMLKKKCTNRITGKKCMRDSVCRADFKSKGYRTFRQAKCEGEDLRTGKEGTCALYETVSCGYARQFAGVGPSDDGVSYITRSLTSTADLVATGQQCSSSTCVIPGSGELLTAGGLEFCNASEENCNTCQRENSDKKGKWTNKPLTQANSVQECAEACAKDVECRFFLYDKASKACHVENTSSRECIEGLKNAPNIDFYELVLAEKDVGCSRQGSTCCPEAHVRAKADGNVKCAFQEPLPDGSYQLNLVNPGDAASEMCENSVVSTLKNNELLRLAAGDEEDDFLDMQNKNSHIRKQIAKNESMREELDIGCCDQNGENCGCPYVADFPVYYQVYEDSEVDAEPAAARLTFPVPGCDAWNDIEAEMDRGNFGKNTVDQSVAEMLRKKGATSEEIANFSSRYATNLLHGSYRLACETGWKTRSCEKYGENPLELSACKSGVYLRTEGAPLNYERGRTLDVATAESRVYLDNMGQACVANAVPGAPNFCSGACVDGRCMPCQYTETCATKFGSEYVCAPFVDVGREIVYDGDLSSNVHAKHSFMFQTCQRKDRLQADLDFIDNSAFAARQRLQQARMKSASTKAKMISSVAIVAILIAVGFVVMRRRAAKGGVGAPSAPAA